MKGMKMQNDTDTTRVLKCTCSHEYQDSLYGKRLRLHNRCGKKASQPFWRCTVCGYERT